MRSYPDRRSKRVSKGEQGQFRFHKTSPALPVRAGSRFRSFQCAEPVELNVSFRADGFFDLPLDASYRRVGRLAYPHVVSMTALSRLLFLLSHILGIMRGNACF